MKIIFRFLLVSFLMLCLISCSTTPSNDNPLILIPYDEIEQVINFSEHDKINTRGGWFPTLLPLSPSEQIHLFFSDTSGVRHSQYVILDEKDQIKKNVSFFSDQDPIDIFDLGLYVYWNPFSITSYQNKHLIYSGSMRVEQDSIYSYIYGIFVLNIEGKNELFYPLENRSLSLYLYQDNILFFSDEDRIYSIDYPITHASEHDILFSLNEIVFPDEKLLQYKEQLSIKNIVYASQSELVLELLLSETKPLIARINLKTLKASLIVNPGVEIKDQQFFYSISKNNFIAIYNNDRDINNKMISLYGLDGSRMIQILNNHIEQNARLPMSIKIIGNDTYLYWIDNFILYRWKVPII